MQGKPSHDNRPHHTGRVALAVYTKCDQTDACWFPRDDDDDDDDDDDVVYVYLLPRRGLVCVFSVSKWTLVSSHVKWWLNIAVPLGSEIDSLF